MAAADKKTDEDSNERVLSRHDPVRHSYHAGDRPALEPSNLRKYLRLLFGLYGLEERILGGGVGGGGGGGNRGAGLRFTTNKTLPFVGYVGKLPLASL